jgi:hypothetical protein
LEIDGSSCCCSCCREIGRETKRQVCEFLVKMTSLGFI